MLIYTSKYISELSNTFKAQIANLGGFIVVVNELWQECHPPPWLKMHEQAVLLRKALRQASRQALRQGLRKALRATLLCV